MTKKQIWNESKQIFNCRCDICRKYTNQVLWITNGIDNYRICKDCFIGDNKIHCSSCGKELTDDDLLCSDCSFA